MKLRSERWFRSPSPEITFQHRAAMRAMGHLPDSFTGKPMIGIFNSWNDLNSCNYPHKTLVEYVKRGILMAGGYPVELHSITTPADFMKPSDLPYRNLMSMDIEEQIRTLPLDGAVMLCECDKTVPAQLMAAASCDIPALLLAAGHRASGNYKGTTLNYGTDLWKVIDEHRSGKIDEEAWSALEKCLNCSLGGCPVMGTSSTMKSMAEMLGMMLPDTAAIPASHARRAEAAELTGRRIVEMVREELRPSQLMTPAAFDNAIKLLAALGGSTNAVLHLTAVAGRLGHSIPLDRYAELTSDVPLLVNMQPSGPYNMDDFFHAGGLSAVIRELLPRLDQSCLSASGVPISEAYRAGEAYNREVIGTLDRPFQQESGIKVLKGTLAPGGAVIKRSAADQRLFRHVGPAYVFDDYDEMMEQLENEELDVTAETVLILRGYGPAAEGMPEWGSIPIPLKLLKQGVKDMIRISDARMSGTSYGTVILHLSPEAGIGGPLAAVVTGDRISVDVAAGKLDLLVPEEEIQARLKALPPRQPKHRRGYMRMYAEHVLQANEGCDLDFLKPKDRTECAMIEPTVGKS